MSSQSKPSMNYEDRIRFWEELSIIAKQEDTSTRNIFPRLNECFDAFKGNHPPPNEGDMDDELNERMKVAYQSIATIVSNWDDVLRSDKGKLTLMCFLVEEVAFFMKHCQMQRIKK